MRMLVVVRMLVRMQVRMLVVVRMLLRMQVQARVPVMGAGASA